MPPALTFYRCPEQARLSHVPRMLGPEPGVKHELTSTLVGRTLREHPTARAVALTPSGRKTTLSQHWTPSAGCGTHRDGTIIQHSFWPIAPKPTQKTALTNCYNYYHNSSESPRLLFRNAEFQYSFLPSQPLQQSRFLKCCSEQLRSSWFGNLRGTCPCNLYPPRCFLTPCTGPSQKSPASQGHHQGHRHYTARQE